MKGLRDTARIVKQAEINRLVHTPHKHITLTGNKIREEKDKVAGKDENETARGGEVAVISSSTLICPLPIE